MFTGDAGQLDRTVRLYVYGHFLEHGGPPEAGQIAEALHATKSAVRASLHRLASDHILVISPESGAILMAMPFSASPTAFEVRVAESSWWANCAWDALGIPAMLNCDARIRASCPDCGEELSIEVEDGTVKDNGEIIHFAVPAAHWWDDIFFT
jgi:hypothetical protein